VGNHVRAAGKLVPANRLKMCKHVPCFMRDVCIVLYSPCNLTAFTPCLTGPVDYPFASRHEGPGFYSQGGTLRNRDSPITVVSLQSPDYNTYSTYQYTQLISDYNLCCLFIFFITDAKNLQEIMRQCEHPALMTEVSPAAHCVHSIFVGDGSIDLSVDRSTKLF
jgi:hypothetical protein